MNELRFSCKRLFLGMACMAALAGCQTPPQPPTETLHFQPEIERPAARSTAPAPVIDFSDTAPPQLSSAWQ